MQINGSIRYDSAAQPACFPGPELLFAPDLLCVASGWGSTDPNATLQSPLRWAILTTN